ncbi:uncharacterized protein METZ01_LOCUS422729 [marine metagenome]|uniref:Uncharacterized protein n=1 Tax=marine metagenome TaxID=408172 RepID=A0A382XGZ3_9ZZZZ
MSGLASLIILERDRIENKFAGFFILRG